MKLKELVFEENVSILVDNYDRFLFFKKILANIEVNSVTFLHTSLYSFFKSKQSMAPNEKNLLLTREFSDGYRSLSIDEAKFGYRVKGQLSKKITPIIEEVFSKSDYIFVFSGFQFTYKCLEKFIPDEKSIFFEIGNFPNKYQWSVKGVNANSDYGYRVSQVENVKDLDVKYLQELLLTFRPPHVSKKISSKALESIFNKLGSIVKKTLFPEPSFFSYLSIALNTARSKKMIKSLSKFNYSFCDEKYCLFIGQVEYDTQTVFQSNEVGISALKKAKKIADERGVRLIVRLHPGEKDLFSLRTMIKFCQLHGIEINNSGALLEAVQYAEFVMTINSTGGVHSILFDKEVITFGDAFYEGWSPKDVVKYYKGVLEDLV